MIQKFGNFIEIKPMTQMGTINEVLSIDLDDRKIVSVHVHAPRSPKHEKILKSIIAMYGSHGLMFVVMEVTTSPDTKKSASMKTISHEIVYYNMADYNSDYEKIRSYIYEGKPF